MGRRCALGAGGVVRGGRRPAARVFQATAGQLGKDDAHGPLALLAPPELLLPVAHVVAYALVALAAPYGWLGLAAPVAMLLLILFVTGIPPAEEQALRSRGEDYRRYERETSAFVPLPPRAA